MIRVIILEIRTWKSDCFNIESIAVSCHDTVESYALCNTQHKQVGNYYVK